MARDGACRHMTLAKRRTLASSAPSSLVVCLTPQAQPTCTLNLLCHARSLPGTDPVTARCSRATLFLTWTPGSAQALFALPARMPAESQASQSASDMSPKHPLILSCSYTNAIRYLPGTCQANKTLGRNIHPCSGRTDILRDYWTCQTERAHPQRNTQAHPIP
jgi:hypothetical protein